MIKNIVLTLITCLTLNDLAMALSFSLFKKKPNNALPAGFKSARYEFNFADELPSGLNVYRGSGVKHPFIRSNRGSADMAIPTISVATPRGKMDLITIDGDIKPKNVSLIHWSPEHRNSYDPQKYVTMSGISKADDTEFKIVWDSQTGGISRYSLTDKVSGGFSEGKSLLKVEDKIGGGTLISLPSNIKELKFTSNLGEYYGKTFHLEKGNGKKDLHFFHSSEVKVMNLNHKVTKNGSAELTLEYKNLKTGEVTEEIITYRYPTKAKATQHASPVAEAAVSEGVG